MQRTSGADALRRRPPARAGRRILVPRLPSGTRGFVLLIADSFIVVPLGVAVETRRRVMRGRTRPAASRARESWSLSRSWVDSPGWRSSRSQKQGCCSRSSPRRRWRACSRSRGWRPSDNQAGSCRSERFSRLRDLGHGGRRTAYPWQSERRSSLPSSLRALPIRSLRDESPTHGGPIPPRPTRLPAGWSARTRRRRPPVYGNSWGLSVHPAAL